MNIELIIENAQLKGRVIALDAEVKCLEAVIRSHERVDCLTVTNLKAEVARLDDELKMEKENEDRLVREFQNANNEVYGLQRQVAALIDNQTHLNSLIANSEHENARLKAQVERLTGLLTQWKDIADAPTGHFIGYHKTKQGLIITGGIWVLEGKARFESGIGNEPTHWCEYPKYPEDIKS